ncbi:MAG: hypothetical protein J6D57_00630 [Mogibacterium sp.]|nr:hypothetical protein [Mogibacterium sp.]
MKRIFAFIICIIIVSSLLAGCGKDNGAIPESPFSGRDTVDLSAYTSMSGQGGESRFVDTTVAEIDQLMKDKESFVFLAAYEDCQYCDLLMPYLNEALADKGTYAGYLDTRKDPSWSSNTDIDDYDLFCKRFGRYLEKDENGNLHLYTPDIYVIKKGRVVAEYQGVVEGADDPENALTSAQEKELRETLDGLLSKLR